jgi:hypothetical protein
LLGGDVIDISQGDEFVDCQFMLFAFEPVKPTGGDLVGLIAPFLGKAKTALLDLS